MRWPRFWTDSGHYNDTVVQVCIGLGVVVGGVLSVRRDSLWYLLGGWGLGFVGGVAMMGILCTVFRKRSDR